MPIVLESKTIRDILFEKLIKQNIKPRKYFYPLITDFEYYKKQNLNKKLNLFNSKYVSDRILCLPIYSSLDYKNIHKIVSIVKSI
jgi:dTDP-4-amino-4,6-dideoxygalactose transaminase